jgi:hypothetical protein
MQKPLRDFADGQQFRPVAHKPLRHTLREHGRRDRMHCRDHKGRPYSCAGDAPVWTVD